MPRTDCLLRPLHFAGRDINALERRLLVGISVNTEKMAAHQDSRVPLGAQGFVLP